MAQIDRIYLGALGDEVATSSPSGASLRTSDGWKYAITEEDLLWLGRAATGEGGNPGDVIWAWMQRLALPQFRTWTLSRLVQGHSQPVNPRWLEDGEFCRPGGRYAGTDSCAATRLRRRAQMRALMPSDWPGDVKSAIAQVRKGTLPNRVPRAVDFAVPSLVQSFLRNHPDAELIERDGNHFIATGQSLAWPSDYVELIGSARWLWWAAAGLGAAAVAGLGYWIWGRT